MLLVILNYKLYTNLNSSIPPRLCKMLHNLSVLKILALVAPLLLCAIHRYNFKSILVLTK